MLSEEDCLSILSDTGGDSKFRDSKFRDCAGNIITGALQGPVVSQMGSGDKACRVHTGSEWWISAGIMKEEEAKFVPVGTSATVDVWLALETSIGMFNHFLEGSEHEETFEVSMSKKAKLIKEVKYDGGKHKRRSPRHH